MKTKTATLVGAALDWAAWVCIGGAEAYPKMVGAAFLKAWKGNSTKYLHPSTDWAQGGPIIEREIVELVRCRSGSGPVYFEARCGLEGKPGHAVAHGPTPLIAAMRAYAASKLGDEVDIPDELLT